MLLNGIKKIWDSGLWGRIALIFLLAVALRVIMLLVVTVFTF